MAGGGIRGKDDKKQNILAPLVHRVKFPRYCVGETVPLLLVNNHSLFVFCLCFFVTVSLSLWYLTFFSFSDDPVITVLVPPSPFPDRVNNRRARLKTGKCADGKGGGKTWTT